MSHRPERKEKDCLNCGTIVQGRFCQVCGQENTEPKETFWGMVMHFFSDITHFDGKFFVTLKDLLFRPGFLSAEYIRGRRASYLHPVRMYVFTSAVFFLVFFSLRGTQDAIKFDNDDYFTTAQRDSALVRARKNLARDTADDDLRQIITILSDSSRQVKPSDLFPFQTHTVISTINGEYNSRHQYDSAQAALPKDERDGWFARLWNKKASELNDRYRSQPTRSMQLVTESLLHRLPYLLFVSLPFFALILKLLYVRRKNFYYADHAIFSVHHYIFSFILLLFVFLLEKLNDVSGWGIWSFLMGVSLFAWPVYLFIAMKKFYRQGFFKTFFKFLFLNLLGLIVLLFLLIFFFLFSIFQL